MKKQAYSLVELSMVLVIISLISFVISIANNMISNAKSRTVISELASLNSAIITFENIYNYLPGDFPGAYTLWGTSCNSNSALCNGNGNNSIDSSLTNNFLEGMEFWQHLSLANLINSNYLGYNALGMQINSNIPNSKYHNMMGYFAESTYLILAILANSPSTPTLTTLGPAWSYSYSAITNIDLFNIDSKIDDGVASTGVFTTIPGYNPITNQGSPSSSCPFNSATNGYDMLNANQRSCLGKYIW